MIKFRGVRRVVETSFVFVAVTMAVFVLVLVFVMMPVIVSMGLIMIMRMFMAMLVPMTGFLTGACPERSRRVSFVAMVPVLVIMLMSVIVGMLVTLWALIGVILAVAMFVTGFVTLVVTVRVVVIVGMLVIVIVLVMMPTSVIVFSFFCHFLVPFYFVLELRELCVSVVNHPIFHRGGTEDAESESIVKFAFLLFFGHPFHDLPLLIVDLHDG